MAEPEIIHYSKKEIRSKIRSAEQELDPNADYPFPVPEIKDHYIIYITSGTYQLLKKYVSLQEETDHLCKSFEDRILDSLLKAFPNVVYAMYNMHEHMAKELAKAPELISLQLRSQTYKYLKIYTYVIGLMRDHIHDVDEALLHLIEQEILEMTIKGLETELAKTVKRG